MGLIRVVFAPMDGTPCIRFVDDSIDALEEMVGAPAYCTRIGDSYLAVINPYAEESGFSRNKYMAKRRFYGNFVVVKTKPRSSEFLDIDDGEFAMFFVAMMIAACEVDERAKRRQNLGSISE